MIINILLKKIIKENFNQNIIFLDNNELFNILKRDDDNYYKSFYDIDYKVRNIQNIEEYINYIKESTINFNNYEKNKIKTCANDADIFFENLNYEWLNGKKMNKIPWKIGLVEGKLYENGLPHTRSDIIIISKDSVINYSYKKLTNTLIHEKVHVYQKIYKNDILKYLNNYNFIKIKKRDVKDNIRSNPDLDEWVYKDLDNNIYKAVYNKNPSSIEDITYYPINKQSYEHPFEKMAIFIENKNK